MNKTLLAIGLLAGGVLAAVALPYAYPPQGPFWVDAIHGSDSTGDGSQGNPWATIGKAQTYIRTNKLNQVQRADMLVNVRAGTYNLASSGPMTFGPLDGGFNGFYVRYVSYDRVTGDCKAHISGGYTVPSWTLSSGTTYTATVPAQFWSPPYENGIRANWARTPNRSLTVGFPNSFSPYFTTQTVTESLTSLAYSTGDISPGTWNLPDVQLMVNSGGTFNWLLDWLPVSSVNTSTHVFTLSQNAKFWPYFTSPLDGSSGGSRYFAQGDVSMLDVGGEAYLNRGTLTLSYIGRDGLAPNQTVVVPQQTELVQIFGTSGKANGDRVTHLVLDGFCFENTDFYGNYYSTGYAQDLSSGIVQFPLPTPHLVDPDYGYFAAQPAFHKGVVHIKNADNVIVQNAHFQQIGTNAIFAEGYAQQLLIQHSLFEKVGLDAIRFEGPYPGEQTALSIVGNNEIYDFKLNSVGELSSAASGIDLAQSGSNLIHYGYGSNGPRKMIWIFGDSDQASSNIYACNNTIDHVKAQFFQQDSCDSGAITETALSSTATTAPFSCQNTVTQTIIDSTQGIPSMTCVSGFNPTGILNDDTTSGQIFTNVNVTNSQGAGYRKNTSATLTPVLTNTSFNADGTQNGSFNSSLMDTANIGTLGSCSNTPPPCFPY